MAQVVPPDRLLAFYNSPIWKERHTRKYGDHLTPALRATAATRVPHHNGRLQALGINPDPSDNAQAVNRLMALQELVDEHTTAVGLMAHYPELASTQHASAAYVRDSVIPGDGDMDQANALEVLKSEIKKTLSWSPVVNCQDYLGNPIVADYDLGQGEDKVSKGQKMQTYSVAENVSSAATPAVAGAKRMANDDMQLKNQLWKPTPGRSTLKSTGRKSNNSKTAEPTATLQYKWTVPYQTWHDGLEFDKNITVDDKGKVSIDGCVAGPGASKRPISFEGAHLEGAKFDKTSFSGAILTNALVALGSGVPLFVLPKEDRQYLTTAGLSQLSSSFKKAGFDLGGEPTVADVSSWNIDNSQSTEPLAPKLYVVKLKTNNSGFKVFSQDKPLFDLDSNQLALLNRPKATPPLSALFGDNNYDLAPDAPITRERAWIISASDDATYLRSYRFIELTVKSDGDALTVYGSQPVLIDKLSEYPKIHFDPTTNLESAFSSNSIGPAGVPFAWITQSPQKIEIERFWTATVGGPGDLD